MRVKIYSGLIWAQGFYTLITALWPLIDVNSFMEVTGPKQDIWLLKTVSVILLAIAIGMIVEAIVRSYALPLLAVVFLSSIGLAFIDFYYSSNDVIWDVYKLDGIAQIIFITLWIYILTGHKKLKER